MTNMGYDYSWVNGDEPVSNELAQLREGCQPGDWPIIACHALTKSGRQCRNDTMYGNLCGVHYSMAEKNISAVKFINSSDIPWQAS